MNSILYHVGLTVTDMERSRRFYEGAFGFTFDRELRMTPSQLQPLMQLDPPSSIHAVYLMLGDFMLELMQWEPAARGGAEQRVFLETGLTHLSIAVDDIAATIQKSTALGGTALNTIGRAAMLRDPDGQLIELVAADIYAETASDRAKRSAGPRV
jgi:lactoylglutathione lyase